MAADDLSMPAYEGGRLDNHEAIQQLSLLDSRSRQQQCQFLSSSQVSTFAQLALQDEDLLPQSKYLAVTIVAEQAGERSDQRRHRYGERCQTMR